MRTDAIAIEESRIGTFSKIDDYTMVHERHRIFPKIFEKRDHKKILDVASGIGVVAKRIKDHYADAAQIICNDISPSCLKIMEQSGLKTISFDLDDPAKPFPFQDSEFDALVCLATIEHMINIDHFVKELHRIIAEDGFLYLSAPNYCGLLYLIPFLTTGKTFHDPLDEKDRYEFYAHVRYFTFRTLIEYVSSFGFSVDTVYMPKPEASSKFNKLRNKSKLLAVFFKYSMIFIYSFMGPRWCTEPVVCFTKRKSSKTKFRKRLI